MGKSSITAVTFKFRFPSYNNVFPNGFSSPKLASTFSNFAFVSSAHYPSQKEMLEFVKNEEFNHVLKLYSDVGTQESENQEISEKFVESNEEIYEVLFDKVDEYSNNKQTLVILTLAEYIYQSAMVVNREITFMACIAKLLKDLK